MTKNAQIEIITEAKPHTIKKFELIEKYVNEWARKILGYTGKNGLNGSKGVIYIDCMSNSGVYKDEVGNPIDGTALRVAKLLNQIILDYPGKHAILIFNDLQPARIEHLKEVINKENLSNIEVSYQNEDCNFFLRGLNLTEFQKEYNTLLLYDPYKAAIDWDAVTPFLNCWGEVIINHMVSDTIRGAEQAKNKKTVERYQETYQKDITSLMKFVKDKNQLNKIILSIISKRTMGTSGQRYIASFPFFNRTNGLIYNLIHCCSNIKGIKLFKEVAWKTFGDKSSLKNTHGNVTQFEIDLFGNGVPSFATDDECFYVRDIAKYIYDKYSKEGTLSIKTVYADLDQHPIFPSDGYKLDIKKELKLLYDVKISKGGQVEFPIKE